MCNRHCLPTISMFSRPQGSSNAPPRMPMAASDSCDWCRNTATCSPHAQRRAMWCSFAPTIQRVRNWRPACGSSSPVSQLAVRAPNQPNVCTPWHSKLPVAADSTSSTPSRVTQLPASSAVPPLSPSATRPTTTCRAPSQAPAHSRCLACTGRCPTPSRSALLGHLSGHTKSSPNESHRSP